MFGFLKKHFKKSVKTLTKKVVEKRLSKKDIDKFFSDNEIELMQSNVAVEVVDFLKKRLKDDLADKEIRRSSAEDVINKTFKKAIMEIVDQGKIDIKEVVTTKKPACIVFLGFNGSGKTSSIAKFAKHLMGLGLKPVLAAGDTFRAASIEQLEHHGEKLRLKTIKHQYGGDAAAVIFDAIKYASGKGLDVILADTAGRSHADKNLMDELEKVVRVNKPALKILVVDSLTGNDAVEQAKSFDKAVGVDGIILTKIDVNKKGGSVLSVCYAIRKPILFFGTGQKYNDLKVFDAKNFVEDLLK